MVKIVRPLLPRIRRRTEALGERLRLARLRRRMSLHELAARVATTRVTIAKLEQGDASVSLGVLLRALAVLGLDQDIDKLATDDELGQRLQDSVLRRPRRRRGVSTDD